MVKGSRALVNGLRVLVKGLRALTDDLRALVKDVGTLAKGLNILVKGLNVRNLLIPHLWLFLQHLTKTHFRRWALSPAQGSRLFLQIYLILFFFYIGV